MAFRSEFEIWRDEIQPPPRLTIAEHVARWFERPAPEAPEVDFYVWHDVAVLVPGSELDL